MRTVLYFTSPTCTKCKIVDTWWTSFVEGNSKYNYKIVDTAETLDEARLYKVGNLPAFVLLGEDGSYIDMVQGAPGRSALQALMDAHS